MSHFSINEMLKDQKVISTVYSEQLIEFTLDDGDILRYEAYGDCCSSSFIEDIDDLEVLQNATILEVDIESGESKENSLGEYTDCVSEWTFYKFKTTKGYATLSFRNDSNGYYNGHLELVVGASRMKNVEYNCCNVTQYCDYEDSFEIVHIDESLLATYCVICDTMVTLGYTSIFEKNE